LLEERHKVEQHQQYFDELKHQLQMMMKDAERAVFTGGSVTWKKSQDSISLDSKSLLKQHPEYYSSFHKPKQEHGDFRFTRMVDKAELPSIPSTSSNNVSTNTNPRSHTSTGMGFFMPKIYLPKFKHHYRGHHHD
jgi:hypothetical protein